MAVPLMMQWLIGTWFILSSDAPIWLNGDKLLPTLNYTFVQKKDTYKLLDETRYTKNGKKKVIAGYDRLAKNDPSAFVWKGRGILFFVTSKWKVSLQDKDGAWAVIHYSKTLFTPDGVDIISRSRSLNDNTISHIHQLMMQDRELAKHAGKLKHISQQ